MQLLSLLSIFFFFLINLSTKKKLSVGHSFSYAIFLDLLDGININNHLFSIVNPKIEKKKLKFLKKERKNYQNYFNFASLAFIRHFLRHHNNHITNNLHSTMSHHHDESCFNLKAQSTSV